MEGTTGNIESKVRSAAEVRMRFFGATFFLEVEVEAGVISVVQCWRQSVPDDRSRNATYGWCGFAMDPAPCPENRRVDQRPSGSPEPE